MIVYTTGRSGAAEDIQDKPPPERRAPPPNRPGEHDQPSRTDSRRGAAAANRTDARPAETKADPVKEPQEIRGEQYVADSRPQVSGNSQRDAAESSGSPESASEDSEDTAAVSAQSDTRAPSIDDAVRPDARLASKAGADIAGEGEEAIEEPTEGTCKADPAEAHGSKSHETGPVTGRPMGLLVDGRPIRES